MEQRTPEWYEARKGKLTGSTFGEAIGLVGSRRRLWRELTGREERYENDFMAHGTAFEPMARALLAAFRDYEITPCGFVVHPSIPWIGCSPDGLVEHEGCVELKCPQSLYEEFPQKYMPQVQGVMEILNRDWCDFLAWERPDPTDVELANLKGEPLPESKARLWRVYRSREYWAELLEHLAAFWTFVEADIEPPVFKRGTKPQIRAMPYVAGPYNL